MIRLSDESVTLPLAPTLIRPVDILSMSSPVILELSPIPAMAVVICIAPCLPIFDQFCILACKLATLSPVMLVLNFRLLICLSKAPICLSLAPIPLNRALILPTAPFSSIPRLIAPENCPLRLPRALEAIFPRADPMKTSLRLL